MTTLSANRQAFHSRTLAVINKMSIDLSKHILKYSLFIIISESILFIAGTFIENQTIPMGFLTLAYLSAFCCVSIVMIRNFRRSTKLKLIEKLLAVSALFLTHEIWGVLFHSVYFVGILGQEPTTQELLNKALEIVKFDSHVLVITAIISRFINSKVVERDELVELSK